MNETGEANETNEAPAWKFRFACAALPEETFEVVRFHGEEGLSACYRFEIHLISKNEAIDLDGAMAGQAVFTLVRDEGDLSFHGILFELTQLHQVGPFTFYRAVLVPRLSWLGLTHHNQVFLDETVPEILASCLRDGGLTSGDFELRLKRDYAKWDYVCQYRQTHLDFVSYWMEREGMYYFFEQTPSGEKLVITDTKISHSPMAEGGRVFYSPASGLEYEHRDEVIHSFRCLRRQVPQSLVLKDYNYETPSLDITGRAEVSPHGRGEVYIYGEHFRTPEEGQALAGIWAEELLCREIRFMGEGTVPFLRPGYLFEIEGHYRDDFNGRYLTVEMEHEGSQASYLLAGLGRELTQGERRPYYRNRFTAISSSVQFRSERKTQKERFHGMLSAKIDASGSGKYAELDSKGRYKVALPFDLSERPGGKGSAWLRMAQPYAGSDHGMHFPLHKGTEVLLTFIDGDPDRPVIAGAVPNPETPSPVTDSNQTKSIVQTASGNYLSMEDQQGSERILLNSPATQSFIRMGQPNDPDWIDSSKEVGKWGIRFTTSGAIDITAGFQNTIVVGENAAVVLGADDKNVAGIRTDGTLGGRLNMALALLQEINIGLRWTCNTQWDKVRGFSHKATAQVDQINAIKQRLTGEQTDAIASLNQAILDRNAVIAAQNRTIASLNQAITAKNDTVASKNSIIAAKTGVIASDNKVIATNTKILAAKNDIVGAKQDTHGALQRTAVNVNRIEGEANNLETDVQRVQALYNQV